MPPTTSIQLANPRATRPPGNGSVPRERLLAKLRATGDIPFIVLSAPAGFGKSTLLRDWVDADKRPVAWLTLGERHNDPAVLLETIAALLGDVMPIPDGILAPLDTPQGARSSIAIAPLREALQNPEEDFILVLDGLDRVDNPDCIEVLVEIAGSVSVGSQIAIASRSEPPLPLGRMRADRAVAELDARDLAMDEDETSRTLAACGLELRPDAVRRLHEHTEGWPVAIYLAALSLTQGTKADAAVADIRGDDRLIAAYVREELLADLAQETLDFLVGTSILDRLSGEICDSVLERRDSAEMLRRLVRSNHLIVPLDRGDHLYRHHVLSQEMLLSELEHGKASVASALHARASAFFNEQGDVGRAVSHAIQSGDRDLAGALIWAHASSFVWSGRGATVRGWLANYTEEQVAASPALCLAQATCSLAGGDGEEVERWTNAALGCIARSKRAANRALIASANIIRVSGAARDGVPQMREAVAAWAESLPSGNPYRALCHLIDGVALHLAAERADARRPLEDAARASALTAPALETLSRAQLALLATDEGELTEAERQAQLAMVKVDRYGLDDDPSQALVFAVSALVRARRGLSGEASAAARTAVRLQTALHEMSPWYEAETRITLGRALILLDDGVAARSHLAAASKYLRMGPDAIVLREWLDTAWAEAQSAGSAAGRWPLTPAELRLLHMLPTHFSFREIADLGFVSQNTVKTQARSVYRKLGVSSRAEAVACARAVGLLSADAPDSPDAGDAPALSGT